MLHWGGARLIIISFAICSMHASHKTKKEDLVLYIIFRCVLFAGCFNKHVVRIMLLVTYTHVCGYVWLPCRGVSAFTTGFLFV